MPLNGTSYPSQSRERSAREVLRKFRRKDNVYALSVVTFDLIAYSAAFFVGASLHSLPGKIGCALVCGIFTGRLFVLGHDACHQNLTSNRSMNQWLARITFLPSMTPYRPWELAHNSIHHVFSNWSKKDYVWAPISKSQFESLSAARQFLERIYRNPFGHGLYYLNEIWWKRLYFPSAKYVRNPKIYFRDSIVVSLFLGLQLFVLTDTAIFAGRTALLQILVMAVLPLLEWNCLMGFTIFLHHTHPDVPWFTDKDKWRSNETQLRATLHVQFAVPFDSVFHHIFKHTAHHLDVGIPHYHLAEAQSAIEELFPEAIIIERFTWKNFLSITHACKLYDYRNNCWLDFDGRVTARPQQLLYSAEAISVLRHSCE